jgi:hypothetical protein
LFLQRFLYIKEATASETANAEETDHFSMNYNSNQPEKKAVDQQAVEEENARLASVALKKEDDDFSKLEMAFLSELGLGSSTGDTNASPAKPAL